jgi:hypothetical protein
VGSRKSEGGGGGNGGNCGGVANGWEPTRAGGCQPNGQPQREEEAEETAVRHRKLV